MNPLRLVMPSEQSQHSILTQTYNCMNYADIILTCSDSNQFQKPVAHKSILSSCSEFLKFLLESNPDSHEIILPDVSTSIMISILTLIYTGEVVVSSQKDISDVIESIELLRISIVGEVQVLPATISADEESFGADDKNNTIATDFAPEEVDGKLPSPIPVASEEYEIIGEEVQEIVAMPEEIVDAVPPKKKRSKAKKRQKKSSFKGASINGSQTITAMEGTNGTLILEDADFDMITQDCNQRNQNQFYFTEEQQTVQQEIEWDPQLYINAAKKLAEDAERRMAHAKRRKIEVEINDKNESVMNYLFLSPIQAAQEQGEEEEVDPKEHLELLKRSATKDHSYATIRKNQFITDYDQMISELKS